MKGTTALLLSRSSQGSGDAYYPYVLYRGSMGSGKKGEFRFDTDGLHGYPRLLNEVVVSQN